MGNTIPGTVTKLLTLIPVLAAVYFFDFPRFWTALTSVGTLAFFILTLSLFVFGVALKRRILAVRLELSRTNFSWGLLLLSIAVLLYVYGSYSGDAVWFHYESLYVLILAYVALRIGGGILRALTPLLGIVALSFLPLGLFPDTLHQVLLVFLSGDLVLAFFLVFARLHVRTAVIPIGMVALGILAWYGSIVSLPVRALYLDLLVPAPLVVLLVPRIRRFIAFPRRAPSTICSEHRLLPNGFCSICGSKLSPARGSENVGFWGLVAVLVVAALLFFATVPALALIGGVPHDDHFSTQGFSGSSIPLTPTGWQVNSTTLNSYVGDTYAITKVYVPTFHPEAKNYTVDYELSVGGPPTVNGPFGIDIPGWSRASNVFTLFGPFHGYLTTYVSSNDVMLAYSGVTEMVFLSGNIFQAYYVGLGFVREFHDANVTSDTAQFLGDLNAYWLPGITTDVSYSSWTAFLSVIYGDSMAVSTFVFLASSVAIIGYSAYRASLLDDKLDRFLTVASIQTEENWSNLSRLLRRSHRANTSEELGLAANASTQADVEGLDSSLRQLEQRRLVRRSLIERGADVVSVWKVVV